MRPLLGAGNRSLPCRLSTPTTTPYSRAVAVVVGVVVSFLSGRSTPRNRSFASGVHPSGVRDRDSRLSRMSISARSRHQLELPCYGTSISGRQTPENNGRRKILSFARPDVQIRMQQSA
eukprot:scaffold1224_cov191-Pinguiococcus_pyrenoidosus.AAC.1